MEISAGAFNPKWKVAYRVLHRSSQARRIQFLSRTNNPELDAIHFVIAVIAKHCMMMNPTAT